MNDLERRALIAWLQSGETTVPAIYTVEDEGRVYLVLREEGAVVAVYRVTNEGQLKRLRRPPLAVTQ